MTKGRRRRLTRDRIKVVHNSYQEKKKKDFVDVCVLSNEFVCVFSTIIGSSVRRKVEANLPPRKNSRFEEKSFPGRVAFVSCCLFGVAKTSAGHQKVD